jgi:hypothetical protein
VGEGGTELQTGLNHSVKYLDRGRIVIKGTASQDIFFYF